MLILGLWCNLVWRGDTFEDSVERDVSTSCHASYRWAVADRLAVASRPPLRPHDMRIARSGMVQPWCAGAWVVITQAQ